jgi:hypothetical protein
MSGQRHRHSNLLNFEPQTLLGDSRSRENRTIPPSFTASKPFAAWRSARKRRVSNLMNVLLPKTDVKPRRSGRSFTRALSRSRLRLRLAVRARRYSAADIVEAGQHNGALARTRRGAPKLDLKRPEQSSEPKLSAKASINY